MNLKIAIQLKLPYFILARNFNIYLQQLKSFVRNAVF
jgi:hypothetical protein